MYVPILRLCLCSGNTSNNRKLNCWSCTYIIIKITGPQLHTVFTFLSLFLLLICVLLHYLSISWLTIYTIVTVYCYQGVNYNYCVATHHNNIIRILVDIIFTIVQGTLAQNIPTTTQSMLKYQYSATGCWWLLKYSAVYFIWFHQISFSQTRWSSCIGQKKKKTFIETCPSLQQVSNCLSS